MPRKFRSTIAALQVVDPADEEKFNCGDVLQPSAVSTRSARRSPTRTVSSRTDRNTPSSRRARSLSTSRAESSGDPAPTSSSRRITAGLRGGGGNGRHADGRGGGRARGVPGGSRGGGRADRERGDERGRAGRPRHHGDWRRLRSADRGPLADRRGAVRLHRGGGGRVQAIARRPRLVRRRERRGQPGGGVTPVRARPVGGHGVAGFRGSLRVRGPGRAVARDELLPARLRLPQANDGDARAVVAARPYYPLTPRPTRHIIVPWSDATRVSWSPSNAMASATHT